jgi:hypothetical protein
MDILKMSNFDFLEANVCKKVGCYWNGLKSNFYKKICYDKIFIIF